MTGTTKPRIAIGPCQYFWPRAHTLAFYERIGASAADCVYLGETVCAKRRELRPEDWIALGRELAAAGKEVVLSTLTLIEARSEMGMVRRMCRNGEFLVEANDMAAVQVLREQGLPFTGGPFLNIYNSQALLTLRDLGMTRWVMPLELDGTTLRALLDAAGPRRPETEVFAHGRLPLAWSARCFTARHHDLPKDQCGLRCIDDPDGRAVNTREGERFLTINGIQTQSGRIHNLLPAWQSLAAAGADLLRLSPHISETPDLVDALARAMAGEDATALARDGDDCGGYWYGAAGMEPIPLS
ncbi:U32 family peptidase [Aquisalimonas asiatica]|uniref:Ubiquinone biosynthesis protein UbiV n=1 Tax=Aquisalimonas asiatica TaxID=406100 RepID=A0A1H8PVS5_9GAMM|nr:U32 family peptidase [Aquisalimonas asiatica]SEO45643.1 Collagenase-like protease, PrtC family [Aquisalimonas asiatica]